MKFDLSFRVWHSSINVHEIRNGIGLPVKYSWNVGEKTRETFRGIISVNEDNSETYASFPAQNEGNEDFEFVFNEFLISIERASDFILSEEMNAARLEIFVGWYGAENTGFSIPCDVLVRMGRLGLGLSFDIYS